MCSVMQVPEPPFYLPAVQPRAAARYNLDGIYLKSYTEEPMEPGTLIRRSRREAGLTQTMLGRELDISQPAIAKLERPGSNPTFETLDRVLRATGHQLKLSASPRASSVDETLIASKLRMSPAERLAAFESSHRSLARLVAMARPRNE